MANILIYPNINSDYMKRNNSHGFNNRPMAMDNNYRSPGNKGSYTIEEYCEQLQELKYNFEMHVNNNIIEFNITDLIMSSNDTLYYNPIDGETFEQSHNEERSRMDNKFKMIKKKDSYEKLTMEEVINCALNLFHRSNVVGYRCDQSSEVVLIKVAADDKSFKIVLKSTEEVGIKDSYKYRLIEAELSKAIF